MDVAYELHDLVLTMDRQASGVLRGLGMTLRQHTALVIVAEHAGLRSRDLAAGLGITPAGATGVVKGLVTAGWVRDEAEPGSGHRQSLRLTPEGEGQLRASTEALGSSFDDVVRDAGHDPHALAATLRSITDRLRGE